MATTTIPVEALNEAAVTGRRKIADRLAGQLVEVWENPGHDEAQDVIEAALSCAHRGEDVPQQMNAARSLIHFGGDDYTNAAGYERFAPVVDALCKLVSTLADCEYHEYSEDEDGVPAREARAAVDRAEDLARLVEAWRTSL